MIIRAIVPAGGRSTRLAQVKGGADINKHSLWVYDRPMIEWPITTLAQAGITQILVMLNGPPGCFTIPQILEDGRRFGVDISYRYVRESRGPGEEFRLARDWARGEPFVVMLGDSLFLTPLNFHNISPPHMWVVAMSTAHDDPRKYVQVNVRGAQVMRMVRKPAELFSPMVQATVWAFSPEAFAIAAELSGQDQEVHIGMIMEEILRRNSNIPCTVLPQDSFLDLGTVSALRRGSELIGQRVFNQAQEEKGAEWFGHRMVSAL